MIRVTTVRSVALGMLLLQVAWLLSVPPFRGMDEWDHAYRAAAVAEGQWRATPEAATRGTGAVVAVPEDIVLAARSECVRLSYTREADCEGVDLGNGMIEVASGAGRYHPFFYAVTGYLTLPLEGVARLYAMRLVSAAGCLALFLLALGALRRWATGSGVWVAMAVGLTPTVAYTTTVMAPNGVEIMAGLAVWTALIGLALARDTVRDTYYLAVVGVAGPLLVTVRSLGPLWLLLIAITTLVAFPVGIARVVGLLRRPLGLATAGLVLVAAAGSSWWAVSQRALQVGDSDGATLTWLARLGESASQLPVWLLQAIGAFPYRDQPAPPWVFAFWLLLGGVLFGVAIRRSEGRLRWAMIFGLMTTAIVPFLITLATINSFGTAWQGRYGLPYSFGLLLLGGLAWDRADRRLGARAWVPGLALFVAGSVLGPLAVLRDERANSPWAGDPAWPTPHPALLAAIVVVAAGLIWMTVVRTQNHINSGSAA